MAARQVKTSRAVLVTPMWALTEEEREKVLLQRAVDSCDAFALSLLDVVSAFRKMGEAMSVKSRG